MFGVAFDGFDQIGDEIGAALVLVDDFRPGGIHALIGTLQAVVEGDAVSAEDDGKTEKDEGQAFHRRLRWWGGAKCNVLCGKEKAASGAEAAV